MLGIMSKKPATGSSVDGYAFVIGVLTLLKQAPSGESEKFFRFFGQYCVSMFEALAKYAFGERR